MSALFENLCGIANNHAELARVRAALTQAVAVLEDIRNDPELRPTDDFIDELNVALAKAQHAASGEAS